VSLDKVDFWDNFKLPEDVKNFREIQEVRTIPLFETNLYQEYANYYAKIKNSYRNNAMFKNAMCYTKALGFSSLESAQNHSYLDTNTMNLRSCFQYYTYEDTTGRQINSFPNIIEIGGGCGDFCKFIFDMGYKGSYTIVDLEETLKIAKESLKQYPVTFATELPDITNSYLISTWGLSETQMNTRPNLNVCSGYLITYQRNIWNLNNEAYFSQYPGYKIEMPWLPWDGGSVMLSL